MTINDLNKSTEKCLWYDSVKLGQIILDIVFFFAQCDYQHTGMFWPIIVWTIEGISGHSSKRHDLDIQTEPHVKNWHPVVVMGDYN